MEILEKKQKNLFPMEKIFPMESPGSAQKKLCFERILAKNARKNFFEWRKDSPNENRREAEKTFSEKSFSGHPVITRWLGHSK